MKYNELTPTKRKSIKRVGRGISAGQGKTAGRGTKGQNARAGGKRRPGFAGGQTPLMQRLPKLGGFRSFKPKAENVYTAELAAFAGKTADNFTLFEAGLISSPYARVKIVTKGELSGKVTVKVQGASEGAKAAIQKAGGTFTETPRPMRQPKAESEKTAKK
jgi:large subunit ribosomal protein L15